MSRPTSSPTAIAIRYDGIATATHAHTCTDRHRQSQRQIETETETDTDNASRVSADSALEQQHRVVDSGDVLTTGYACSSENSCARGAHLAAGIGTSWCRRGSPSCRLAAPT
jgi:hypothetical protein